MAEPSPSQKEDVLERIKALQLSEDVQTSLARLAEVEPCESSPWKKYTRSKSAGVLVLLYASPGEDGMRVLLTKRALHLRNFPGETALPGGRVDDIDANINDTALREAAEEVELDTGDCPLVFLTRLQPILSRNLLFVFPVVYFVASPRPAGPLRRLRANPQEVASIFNAPLSGFILRSEIQHSWTDVSSFMGATYRLHAFDHASFDSPITGMTAEVLIRVASIAYGVDQLPFDLVAPGSGRNSAESVALLVQQHREQGLLE